MKKLLFLVILLSVSAFSACIKDPNIAGACGSIVLQSNVDTGVDEIRSKADITQSENVAGYWLTISGPESYQVERTLGTETTVKNLAAGEYTVTLRSHRTYTLPAYGLPVYGASVTKNLLADRPTPFTLECTQINTGIRFVFDKSVTDYYSNPVATVTDANSQALSLAPEDEGAKIAYFDPGTLRVSLKDDNNPEIPIGGASYKEIEVEARHLWTITLRTSNQSGNTVDMQVTVDDMVTDKEVDLGVGKVTGTGLAESPFSVASAINAMPASGVWVEGYVLGSTTLTRAGEDNLVLGADPESAIDRGIVAEISVDRIRTDMQLPPDADLKGLRVAIKGNVTGKAEHFDSPAFAAITNVSQYSLNYFTGTAPINLFYHDKVLKDAPFPVGAASSHTELEDDPVYINILKRDFNSLTATYTMKMEWIWRNESNFTNYNFGDGDRLVAFAKKHGMRVHGHTLIWSQIVPAWLKTKGENEGWDQAKWTQVMEDYIKTVVTHYAHQVDSWDVVNEAFNDSNGTLRGTDLEPDPDTDSFWYDKVGSDFIAKAFRAARQALEDAGDRNCKLFYNDYALSSNETKRDGVAAYIQDELLAKGVPIDGIGLQCHVEVFPIESTVRASFQKFADMGLWVHVSELDAALNNPGLINGNELQGKPITHMYYSEDGSYKYFEYDYWQGKSVNIIAKAYMDHVPQSQRFGITTWALTDRYSMSNGNYWGHPDWPGLFQKSYRPKRAYHGLLEGIQGTDWEAMEAASNYAWRWETPGGYEEKAPWE